MPSHSDSHHTRSDRRRFQAVRRAERVSLGDHPVAGCAIGGDATVQRCSPDGYPLWLYELDLTEGATVSSDASLGDHALYVLNGELELDGRTCTAGGAAVVEAGVALSARAAMRTTALHMGRVDLAPVDGGPLGPARTDDHRIHVIGPRGVIARTMPGLLTKYFATSSCPTCRLLLMYSSRKQKYVSSVHSHTEDELIYVLDGTIRVGSTTLTSGEVLAVPADVRYRFESGDDGYAFLTYRPNVSWHVQADGTARLETGGGGDFMPTGDGGDYVPGPVPHTHAEHAPR